MKRALLLLAAAAALAVALLPVGAPAHPERPTVFPKPQGEVPTYRKSGPRLVVCKKNSRKLIRRSFKGRGKKMRRARNRRLRLVKACRFRHVQAAVTRARTGQRILILPGVYREQPSRAVPFDGYKVGPCGEDYAQTEGFADEDLPPPAGPSSVDPPVRPDRNHQVKCPNSKNLVAVIGDDRPEESNAAPAPDPPCRLRCNLQIEGLGRKPTDVLLVGDRQKMDVLRVDRAHGVYIRNLAVEQAAFNGIDLVEVNGFVVEDVVARYNQNYGVLSFSSTNGLYDTVEAYGNGDAGVYPGSNMKGCAVPDYDAYATCEQTGCQYWTTEIRNVNSYGNVQGYSGTAGNSVYVHDSKFHDNSIGLTTDSFASGHPGMPQECSRWENNEIYSNNVNHFTADNQQKCIDQPFEDRPREQVCPQFQVPVGSGALIFGGNRNVLSGNRVYDNWRLGFQVVSVPAAIRDDTDPDHQRDTSNGNRFENNRMGIRPDGTRDPNGVDLAWDGQGRGNCWSGNQLESGPNRGTDPPGLPPCPDGSTGSEGIPVMTARMVPCGAWDPYENPRPIGCDWFDVPPEPQP